MHRKVELAEVELVELGLPSVEPAISAEVYRNRIQGFRERLRDRELDVGIVYGDREHSSNIAFLTGYDPRFEEALFIVPTDAGRRPVLLVGNEGMGYVPISPVRDDFDVELYQTFSLLGQPRDSSRRLGDILLGAGIAHDSRVGVAGWKYFDARETDAPEGWLEIPSYVADTLRDLSGERHSNGGGRVVNCGSIFMDSTSGLRAVNEVEQLAFMEFTATFASQAVRNVVFQTRPGMSEIEACSRMGLNGIPLCCHPMMSAGDHAYMGLPSPGMRAIGRGEPVTTACGLWGALSSRAGFMATGPADLDEDRRDYVEKLVAPYFEAVAAWYETVGIGVTGGELYRVVHDRIGDPFFGVSLNPGHLIHLDEWLNSPIYRNSNEKLVSGMALQVDIIPATGTRYFASNIEDGIALADERLRSTFAELYPEAWKRIQARRDFMTNTLGIHIKPEVLPFSNIPAYLPPFWLSPGRAMRVA